MSGFNANPFTEYNLRTRVVSEEVHMLNSSSNLYMRFKPEFNVLLCISSVVFYGCHVQ
jgi:hypothetical protein